MYDPQRLLSEDVVRVYERSLGERYRLRKDTHLPELGLRVSLWEGEFEGQTNTWLRWYDTEGNVIQTGEERAVRAEARATETEARAQRGATARQEAETRAAQAEAELARMREELERLKTKG